MIGLTIMQIKMSEDIPSYYDQRLYGLQTYAFNQYSCGSCWSATVASAAETGLLRARAKLQLNESTDNLKVSVEWILETSYSNNGCDGGDFSIGVYDLIQYGGNFTREKERPYRYKTEAQGEISQVFNNIYQIYDDDVPFSNDSEAIERVKFFISRGIPVAIGMAVKALPFYKEQLLSNWNGELLTGKCNKDIDHQVLIVGYGKYKGKECWLIKNSWGSGFGQYGYFFVEIGKNSLCTEQEAYAALPLGFSMLEPPFTLEDAERNGLQFVYSNLVRKGRASFDYENGKYHIYWYIGYLGLLAGAVLFLAVTALGCTLGARRRIKDRRFVF